MAVDSKKITPDTQAQETAFEVNEFYRDNYRRVMKMLSFMVVVCAILSSVLAWISYDRKQPPYYASITTGEVIPMHSLSEPVVTTDFVLRWSELATRQVYNLDFATYQQQLAKVQPLFTPNGWEKLLMAFKSSGLLDELVGSRLVISSVVTGPPVILARSVMDGRFTWRIQMRLLITYTSASETRQSEAIVTMAVQRVSTLDAAQGIQIIDFDVK